MEIRLPQLGEGADSGSVAAIFVKEGDTIQKDDPLIELESEKAVAAIPSSGAGTVTKIHVAQGDTIKVGQLLVTLAASGTAATTTAAAGPPAAAPAAPTAPPATAAAPTAPLPAGVEPAAAPSIRRIARELGIDLRRLRGSERGGRIVIGDLRTYIEHLQTAGAAATTPAAAAPAAPAPHVDFSKWGPITRKPMTPLRRTIARRMHESWSTIPQVTQFDEADITALMALRKQQAPAYEKKGARLTLTPFVLKALAAVLKQHPLLNASLDENTNEIVFKDYVHIGIAVDTEHGLMVPVLRDVDQKTMFQLATELEELAAKAKERKVSADDLKGGTFTISNQGGIGGAHFTPIVNRPEVAILGLGRGALQAVVTKDKIIEPRLMLPLCLSYDHRLVDGANAARFIVDLVEALQREDEEWWSGGVTE